jgi:uncharacterized protein
LWESLAAALSRALHYQLPVFPEFQRAFGDYFDFGPPFAGLNFLPHAVAGFFANGGRRVYIRRVIGTGSSESTATAKGGLVTRLLADAPVGNQVRLAALRGIQNGAPSTQLTLTQIKDGATTASGPHTVTVYDSATNIVTLGSPLNSVFEARYTTVATNLARPNTFSIGASSPGTWGNSLDLRSFHMSSAQAQVAKMIAPAPSSEVELDTADGFYIGAQVEFDLGRHKVFRRVAALSGKVIAVDTPFAALTDLDPDGALPTVAYVAEFGITVSSGDVNETFENLTLENVNGHFYFDQINSRSNLVRVGATGPLAFPSGDDGLRIPLTGGLDGNPPGPLDYVGADGGPGNRTGLQSLMDIPQISIVAVPGVTAEAAQQGLVDHSELMRYRVALLDPEPTALDGATYIAKIQAQRQRFDTKYAALYCPRVTVLDSSSNLNVNAPPSGHIAGICARVAEERGVHKAPSNEVIRWIVAIEIVLNKAEQGILNQEPSNINVIRDFRSECRAIRVWAARCITTDSAWKYLNVRRLCNFIEASLAQGTQYAGFEPNDEKLWAKISQNITGFLLPLWRAGALLGSKQEEAFFVKCDRTTMTQDDLDDGRLIILIGVAPIKPAEFVIIRVGQKSCATTVEEHV